MSRDALTRLFPDGKTVFIPADGQPMPGYEQARAEIEARGGDVQVARGGGIGGLFSWLFGGGGADDAEESGGQEATTTMASTGNARGGRSGGPQARAELRSPMSGRRRSPRPSATCRPVSAYASAPEPAPAAKPAGARCPGRRRWRRPSVICRPVRLTPARPSQRRRRQSSRRRLLSWSSPTWPATLRLTSRRRRAEVHRAAAAAEASRSRALSRSPTRPCRQRVRRISSSLRRPTKAAALLSRRRTRDSARPSQRGLLPQVITAGVDRAPTGALALAEALIGAEI